MGRLTVLMYHNISENDTKSNALTISIRKFEEQLIYLTENNFNLIFASEVENLDNSTSKNVCISFDDVTQNQLFYAIPLLEKYNCKATFFIPFSFVGKTDLWNKSDHYEPEKIMTIEELKSMNPNLVEFGHHSYYHQKYETLTTLEIQNDFEQSNKCIKSNQLEVQQTLAYPYGNFPKKSPKKELFFSVLEKNNIKYAFRIGNRVNKLPLKNRYLIQRVDVKGQDKLWYFKWKLRFGKFILF